MLTYGIVSKWNDCCSKSLSFRVVCPTAIVTAPLPHAMPHVSCLSPSEMQGTMRPTGAHTDTSEMATGTPGPTEDGSWRGNPSPFFPWEGLSEDRSWSLCRTEQSVSCGAMTSLVPHLLMFALPLPLTLSYLQFCFPGILLLNKVLTYKLLLSLCFLEILGRDSSK